METAPQTRDLRDEIHVGEIITFGEDPQEYCVTAVSIHDFRVEKVRPTGMKRVIDRTLAQLNAR